ncbi:carbon-nitrogen hydrolase family protein [Myxosarcina sp. GI1(2024)]
MAREREFAKNIVRTSSSEMKDKFFIVERVYSHDESQMTIGLANLRAIVPDIEANKDKMARATEIFKNKGVNLAIFPEFSLSGYFWEDTQACRQYMDSTVIENHTEWIDKTLKPMLDDRLKAIVFNNIRQGNEGKYFNTIFTLAEIEEFDYLQEENTYDKIFLPPIEKIYTETGGDDRLVVDTKWGRFGFTSCYDYLFSQLLLEYAKIDKVDAIIQIASWRSLAQRNYPAMNIRSDTYYGYLWDTVIAAKSAINQVWTLACNAVGRHDITGAHFWGGSGIWAPSGINLVQASHLNEELLIIHNVDIKGQRVLEKDDFNYAFDFESIYQPVHGKRTFTRIKE